MMPVLPIAVFSLCLLSTVAVDRKCGVQDDMITKYNYIHDYDTEPDVDFASRKSAKDRVNGSSGTDRINGGVESADGNWPWIVNIGGRCTGFFVHPQWIVTAGHCFNHFSDPTVVKYGTMNLKTAKQVTGREWFIHPNYAVRDIGATVNDIALLKLDEPLDVPFLCISKNIVHKEFVRAVAAGYGNIRTGYNDNSLTQTKFNTTEICHEVPLMLSGHEFCPVGVEGFVCTAGLAHGVNHGDSGGPLMVVRNGRWYAIGITSYGIQPYFELQEGWDHDVYTGVAYHCDWLAKVTGGEVTCEYNPYDF